MSNEAINTLCFCSFCDYFIELLTHYFIITQQREINCITPLKLGSFEIVFLLKVENRKPFRHSTLNFQLFYQFSATHRDYSWVPHW